MKYDVLAYVAQLLDNRQPCSLMVAYKVILKEVSPPCNPETKKEYLDLLNLEEEVYRLNAMADTTTPTLKELRNKVCSTILNSL